MNRGLAALVLSCLMATTAAAGDTDFPFPDPGACLLPSHITLVGYGEVGPDSVFGHFEVVLRDRWGGTYPSVLVIVDFGAAGLVRPATDQQDPRLTVYCPHRTVRTLSGPDGVASFTIVGGGGTGAQPPHTDYAVIMTDYGASLGSVPVAVLDLDGQNGVTLADLAVWSADFFSGQYYSRSDYDGSSSVTLADLSLWAAAYFGGGSSASPVLCP